MKTEHFFFRFLIFVWLIVLSPTSLFTFFPWHTCHKIQFNRYTVVISKEEENILTLIERKSSIFEFPFTMICFVLNIGKIFKKIVDLLLRNIKMNVYLHYQINIAFQ